MSDLYNVTIAPEALVEIARIVTWWRQNRQAAPQLFKTELDKVLVRISERPEIGRRARSQRVGNARVLLLTRSSYYVVHVRHARRRPLRRR